MPKMLVELATYYVEKGQHLKGSKLFEGAAWIDMNGGRYREAITLFKTALHSRVHLPMNDDTALLRMIIADLHINRGERQEAIDELTTAKSEATDGELIAKIDDAISRIPK